MKNTRLKKCTLHIGQAVTFRAFRDCFGKDWPAVTGLTVQDIEPIRNDCSHWRITAIGTDGKDWIRAAERFFVKV